MTPTTHDQLQRFVFDGTDVRGEIVTLNDTYAQVLARHTYPQPVADRLGELLAAASLLTATLKLDGIMSIEVRGDGPVTLLMVESNPGAGDVAQRLRGIARFDEATTLAPDASLADLIGTGHIVITLDPREGKRYQGIVALSDDTLAGCLEHYFQQSEQLPTRLWLAADGEQRAAGLLLQQLPEEQHTDDRDAWSRLGMLADTVKSEELTQVAPVELLFRLFHEEQTRVFEPAAVQFGCTCSHERFAQAMLGLGEQELREVLAEQGKIEAQCHFCNTHYRFSAAEIESLIDAPDAPAPTLH